MERPQSEGLLFLGGGGGGAKEPFRIVVCTVLRFWLICCLSTGGGAFDAFSDSFRFRQIIDVAFVWLGRGVTTSAGERGGLGGQGREGGMQSPGLDRLFGFIH